MTTTQITEETEVVVTLSLADWSTVRQALIARELEMDEVAATDTDHREWAMKVSRTNHRVLVSVYVQTREAMDALYG